MDAFKRHIEGYRRGGKPCPCCVETSDKDSRSRMARRRLHAADRREVWE
jgi:hypothetical protein